MYIVIFITVGEREEAYRIARVLVDEGYAACVNIVDRVRSIFRWEGNHDEVEESLLIVKSLDTKLAELIERVKELHSYRVPEIIAIEVMGGSKDYLEWVSAQAKVGERETKNG